MVIPSTKPVLSAVEGLRPSPLPEILNPRIDHKIDQADDQGPKSHSDGIMLNLSALNLPKVGGPSLKGSRNTIHQTIIDHHHIHIPPKPCSQLDRWTDKKKIIKLIHIPFPIGESV